MRLEMLSRDEIETIHIKSLEILEKIGIGSFFSRLSRGAQIAIFAIVHLLTGFIPGQTVQSELAKFGIRLHMSVIPAIIILICTIIYWKFSPLTQEKIIENKQKLAEVFK